MAKPNPPLSSVHNLAAAEKNATIRSLLYHQLFKAPPPIRDIDIKGAATSIPGTIDNDLLAAFDDEIGEMDLSGIEIPGSVSPILDGIPAEVDAISEPSSSTSFPRLNTSPQSKTAAIITGAISGIGLKISRRLRVWTRPTNAVTEVYDNAVTEVYTNFQTPPLIKDIDLRGKTAIVTGANSGVGLETCRQLLELGLSKLILAVRDESKGERARWTLLLGPLEQDAIEVWNLDMLSYSSVMAFVGRVKTLERLDIAVLSAGIFKNTYELSPHDLEESLQVNFMSTALLSCLLLPIFKAKATNGEPGHLVWLQSEFAALAGRFQKRNYHPKTLLSPALWGPEHPAPWERYGTTKLLGQIFVTELAKRVPSSIVIITMPTPGLCHGTNLGNLPGFQPGQMIVIVLKRLVTRRLDVGVRAIVHAATCGAEFHGQYLQECQISPKAPIIYSDEFEESSLWLYNMTMGELAFSRAGTIVQELGYTEEGQS